MNKSAFWAVLVAAGIAGISGVFIKSMQINPISQAWLVATGVPLSSLPKSSHNLRLFGATSLLQKDLRS